MWEQTLTLCERTLSFQTGKIAPNRAVRDNAHKAVLGKAGSLETSVIYAGVVTSVKEFGAFVRIHLRRASSIILSGT